jgi:NAD(P)-dependent dehydrogenase (short-subunit alcohol dehydrogenase family)
MANSKDVVVTGVSTGIGWGTTKVLVSKGFRVFGSVRKQADADRLLRSHYRSLVGTRDANKWNLRPETIRIESEEK